MDEEQRKDSCQAGKTEPKSGLGQEEEARIPDFSTLPRCPDNYSFEIGV